MSLNNKIYFIALTILTAIMFYFFLNRAKASEQPEYFKFPLCQDQSGIGDKAHYEIGFHQIVGNGILEGSDDVYSLEEGNFLQCFCSQGQGIQTNWLRNSWGINGLQWDLGDYNYKTENTEYSCKKEEPTPTSEQPTSTPTIQATENSVPSSGDGRSDGHIESLGCINTDCNTFPNSPYDGKPVGWK